MMPLVAARLLADLDAGVVDPASATGDRTTYDVAAILDEVRGFAARDQALLDGIAAVPDVRGEWRASAPIACGSMSAPLSGATTITTATTTTDA